MSLRFFSQQKVSIPRALILATILAASPAHAMLTSTTAFARKAALSACLQKINAPSRNLTARIPRNDDFPCRVIEDEDGRAIGIVYKRPNKNPKNVFNYKHPEIKNGYRPQPSTSSTTTSSNITNECTVQLDLEKPQSSPSLFSINYPLSKKLTQLGITIDFYPDMGELKVLIPQKELPTKVTLTFEEKN